MTNPRDLPTGKVTLLFTDVEGSTKLLHELGPDTYAAALAEHRRILRDAFSRHGGAEIDTQGDAFFYAFPSPGGAVDAARDGRDALSSGPVRVRIGIHTGTPHVTDEGYIGPDVHKGARIAAAGHGGQVLVSKETRALVEVEVADLGEHRLKDFTEPVWIYQLGAERFPPLKTISNTNLPRPASSFVGRERERDRVIALLRDRARLVTLTGPGGTGKTRLSIEAASELVSEFPNGVFWVGLATLRDPALVTATIGQTLGAKDGLAEHIGDREMLLLLDNFEQVVDAAPELSPVLTACPNLRVLVTSRELLRIQGEIEYPVPPLAQPEAVELFCTRSGLEPDDTIAELCDRLDDLPLAVELAAARTSVLSPRQILERISKRLDLLKGGRDADPRQATLRATIEWSYDLLDDDEKQLFARFAVFRGGCTLESAEQVAGAELDTLQSLVDKSLIRHTQERFWMLETIREYAIERLEAAGEAEELRRRHGEHFVALAEEAEPHLRRDSREWLDRLERERDNLRATLDRSEALRQTESAMQMAGALARFWYLRGHLAEGQRRLENALAADARPTAVRARALNGAAVMALNSGDLATTTLRAEEGLELHRRLGDEWGAAYSVMMLGNAASEEADMEKGRALLDDSARRFRELGDELYTLLANFNLGWVTEELGDRDGARALHEGNLRRARELGNERIEAGALTQLAMLARDDGKLQDASSMLKEALRLDRDNVLEVVINLGRLAAVLADAGREEIATRLLSSSEALTKEIGAGMPWWAAERNQRTLTTIRAQLDDAAFDDAWEQGRALTFDEAVALALDSPD